MSSENTYYYYKSGNIEDSEESVYNLIEKPVAVQTKGTMYKSLYPKDTMPTASTFGLQNSSKPGVANLAGDYTHADNTGSLHMIRKAQATFGRTAKDGINPKTYLKKGDKTLLRPSKFRYPDHEFRKPPVPKKGEKPIMGLTTEKNFIVANAVEVILSQPKKLKDPQPRYTQKPEFGKVPEYLDNIKQEIENEKAYIAQLQSMQQTRGGRELRLLTEDEQQRLIDSLKDKWTDIHQRYQAFSFSMLADQLQAQKREVLEAQMDEIERDIERLSKKNLYIYDDEYDEYGF